MSKTTAENKKPSSLSEALSEAEQIIDAAEKRVQELMEKAEKSFKEASEKGYQEGLKRGEKEAVNAAVRLLEQSTSVGNVLAEEASKLSLAICETIIGEHVNVSPETAKNIALKALQESVIGDSVTLIVNPQDKTSIEKGDKELRRLVSGASLIIETDDSISRGGCIVRSDFGEVDATIKSLLEAVKIRLGIKPK